MQRFSYLITNLEKVDSKVFFVFGIFDIASHRLCTHPTDIIKLFPRPWNHKSDLTDPISAAIMAIAFMGWFWPQNSISLIYWRIRWWENPPRLDNNTIRNTRYAGKNVGRTLWFPLDERRAINDAKIEKIPKLYKIYLFTVYAHVVIVEDYVTTGFNIYLRNTWN